MTAQLPLFKIKGADVFLKDVPVDECIHSRFNTRKTRTEVQIERLAERLQLMGFERTRALWAVQENGRYEVFAGGTRLEAAKRAGLDTVPIMLHVGLADSEIARRTDADNENDEYHQPVSPIDVWAEYARLKEDEDWTQDQIAKAKGVAQALVSERLALHCLSKAIKDFITQGLLTERHLRQIIKLSPGLYFCSWLTAEQAWLELAEIAVNGIRKDGKKSSRATAKDVEGWRGFIDEAERVYEKLKPMTLYEFSENDDGDPEPFTFDAPTAFVDELAERKARSKNAVREAARSIRLYIKDNLTEYEAFVKEKSAAAARAAIQAEQERAILGRFYHGDCVDVLSDWLLGPIRLLFTDPPYGKSYQSNRRWASSAPDKIAGDGEDEAALLLARMIESAMPNLADNAHVLVFCDWRGEPAVRDVLVEAGLNIKGSLIWVKEEHSAGDLRGAFGPSHERIIHAVKGIPEITPRIRDVLEFARTHESSHPTEKPVDLLKALIKSTTNEGDLIVDPFAGCASALVAAMSLDREFWGAEIDADFHDEGCTRLLKELG